MARPLVYYAVSIFMGCFTVFILFNNPILGAVIAASFLSVMFFTIDKNFYYLIVCFFMLGCINYYAYFNINLPNKQKLLVRISDKSSFYCYAKTSSKKILLEGDIYKLTKGRKVWISGNYEKVPVYERGVVGTYRVDDYKICNEDLISKIESFRSNLYNKFSVVLGKEKTALVMAVCFGDSSYIEKAQKEDFKKLGIIHVISVSGLHMSIVYKVLEFIIGYKIAILFSFLYMIFSGSQASTIRAFIMIFILKISSKVYKKYDNLSSISLAAIILLIIRPFSILDIGFMLSFLCVLGIVLYNKKINKILYKLPSALNESFSLSISSQIFSLPYATFALKTFSLGFLFSNLLLLPIYTLVVVLGNIALVCYFFYGLFNIINYGLYTVLIIIEFMQKILCMLLPGIIYFSYMESLVIFGLYLCYLGIKSGYSQFKYVPISIIFFFVFQFYSIFPQISYISLNKNDIVLIQYRKNTIAVTTGNINVLDLKVHMKINNVIVGYLGDSTISLGGRCIIRLISHGVKIETQVCFLEKPKIEHTLEVFNNNQLFKKTSKEITASKNFVILKKDDTYTPSGTIINKYIIIRKQILKF